MDGFITIGTKLDTKQFDAQIAELEREIKETEALLSDAGRGTFKLEAEDVSKLNAKLEIAKNKLAKLNQEREKANKSKGLDNLKQGADNLGNSLEKTVKKASRLVLGIFGIRSAYMMLRRASSELASYDEQYAANLEYIRFVLTQAIAPVLRYIVNLAMELLGYINAILQAWFGINLLENASLDDFNNMKKGVNGVTGAVKELKKQFASFDELNIIQNAEDASTGGAAGGVLPYDISQMQGKIPEWLKWIIDNKDVIENLLAAIGASIVAIKLGLGGIKALGIGVAVYGIIKAIKAIKDYLDSPTWQNFGKVIQGIGIAIAGVGIAIGSLPVAIAGVVTFAVGIIVQHWEEIKSFLQGGVDWLKEKIDWVKEHFGYTIGQIYSFITYWAQYVVDIFDAVFSSLKMGFDGIIMFIKSVFAGDWEQAWIGLQLVFEGIFGMIPKIAERILSALGELVKTFANILGYAVKGIFSGIINFWFSMVEMVVNRVGGAINRLVTGLNYIPGINIPFIPNVELPRLKRGGIINMPNNGVVLGGRAIVGEAGAEGVIPLTDSQQMEILGEAIGRYITINASIPVSMNGRLISRELRQVQAEQEFAYNM